MKVLMLGWEFPPRIAGGLAVACYGLVRGLVHHGVKVTFVMPLRTGDEPPNGYRLLGANEIDIPFTQSVSLPPFWHQVTFYGVRTVLGPYLEQLLEPELHFEAVPEPVSVSSEGTLRLEFSGKYGTDLLNEVYRYAYAVSHLAEREEFDIIHAHDWLTYLGGLWLKEKTGKPLVVHVHATEYDRSGENPNPQIRAIEQMGMEGADLVIAVSFYTRSLIIEKYGISPEKIWAIHNAVLPKDRQPFERPPTTRKVVTFLGRVTYQKGPEYFVEAAARLASYLPEAHFVMAGTGDLLRGIIRRVAQLRLGARFSFTGFLPPAEVERLFDLSDVYVMPSVSEPFGISALEALRAGVPVIISRQSGVAEVLPHALMVDFWDVDGLADLIYGVLRYKGIRPFFIRHAQAELSQLQWERSSARVIEAYKTLSV
ncbi:MAG: glycosyltransferase family 4 protein [Bacteroidia bacterium]|nr:glycosyltransferase family 4 protein [Bacteroidia bacterium]MCX7652044.1 glycosyltransferase family 4 protein [Bacteroidia bacterium]MDW8416285.1 glycosyltransferase family 4 protein [Bacteroidia bacterium]